MFVTWHGISLILSWRTVITLALHSNLVFSVNYFSQCLTFISECLNYFLSPWFPFCFAHCSLPVRKLRPTAIWWETRAPSPGQEIRVPDAQCGVLPFRQITECHKISNKTQVNKMYIFFEKSYLVESKKRKVGQEKVTGEQKYLFKKKRGFRFK